MKTWDVGVELKANAANILTACRAVLCIPLAMAPVFSPMFFAVYIACGITDMIDGPVARRMGTASSQGARLDSAADFVFVVVCLAKILPVFALPVWAYLWIGGIALLKAASMVVGYRHEGSAALPHTKLNKATGLALFVLPLVFMLPAGALQVCVLVCIVGVCVLATCAAIQEHLFTCR